MTSPQLFPNTGTPQLFNNNQASQEEPQLFGTSHQSSPQLFSNNSTPQLFNEDIEVVLDDSDELSNDIVMLMDHLISLLDEEGEESLSMILSGARSMYVYG